MPMCGRRPGAATQGDQHGVITDSVCVMDAEDRIDTQWTVAANAAYEQCATAFLEALQRHVSQTLSRKGRQAEWGQYFESADELRKAAVAFDNAEFDWCGSFPLGIQAFEDDEEDEGDEEDEEDEVAPASNGVLTAVGRWDYRITDTDAVVAAGRAAYSKAWRDATPEDALERVQGPETAASEIIHADGWSALSSTTGLLLKRDVTQFITHDELDDDEWEENPFRIVED
jgi:hypothetical protein